MYEKYDVIIVGTGASGLYTTLSLPTTMKILLITKRELLLCNSTLAQGGIAAVYKSNDDNPQLHLNDTLIAGGFKNNPDAIKILVNEAAVDMEKLMELGIEFDLDANGNFHRTLEGGHSRHRIFHHKDSTGQELVSKLALAVKRLDNVDILENALLCGLKKTSTGFSADILLNGENHRYYNTHYCVLATGGIGRVFEHTTNSSIATGDGITYAYEMGAEIRNINLIQFHPTAFYDKEAETRESFLISEAVRGEGAYLLNCNGERFMKNYDERLELAPRDVVSRAIIKESIKINSKDFFLDITHVDSEFVKARFPMIYAQLMSCGYDMTKEKIPIFPCQHYLMGGVDVNLCGMSEIEGLYAVGECSHTGVHGNNRLASNSLLEALVFSRRTAKDIAKKNENVASEYEDYHFNEQSSNNTLALPVGLRTEIRHIMQNGHFVIPNTQSALEGFERICVIKKLLESEPFNVNADYIEAKSLATVAYLILKETI